MMLFPKVFYFAVYIAALFMLEMKYVVADVGEGKTRNMKKVGTGTLYYNGETVRTVVPPAASPKEGVDDLYVITDGADGQLPVIGSAPGDTDYHGGRWAFHFVTFGDTDAYMLTSKDAVLTAESGGDVVVMRVPENDFLCPIQP